MIYEALTWLTTPAPDWARKGGYLKELIAIQARHRRCRADWASHLDKTREVIRHAIPHCAQRRHVVIYGSGLLLDIPFDSLSEAFDAVTLVDVAHLRATRRKARRHANVTFLEMDIAGVVNGLLLGIAKGADTLPRPVPPTIENKPLVDLVVSANLLSQLPLLPCRFLSQTYDFPEKMLNAYAGAIMQAHLDHIASFNAVQCLIAETETQHVDKRGNVIHTEDSLHGVAFPASERTWQWNIAPRGEVSQAHAVCNIVSASTRVPPPRQ